MIIETSRDTTTLITGMFEDFKRHLRILDDLDDEEIKFILSAAIGTITRYIDTDLFLTGYECKDTIHYRDERWDYYYDGQSRFNTDKLNISGVIITAADNTDVTSDFIIDNRLGYIYPNPKLGNKVIFSSGFATSDDVPDDIKYTIFRYGAEQYEMRESSAVGDAKQLPDWAMYNLASLRKQKV